MLTEMPVRERGTTIVTSPDRISAIYLGDAPKKGMFGQNRGGSMVVTINFICGKHYAEEFAYKKNCQHHAKQAANAYMRQLYTWIDENQ